RHYYYGNPTLIGGGGFYPVWNDGKEYRSEALAADGATVLRAAINDWDQMAVSWASGDPTGGPANNPHIKTTTTKLMDSSPFKVSMKTAVNPNDPNDIRFDAYNNQTDVWEYDSGDNSPGPLIRHTHTDFLQNANGTNYQTNT